MLKERIQKYSDTLAEVETRTVDESLKSYEGKSPEQTEKDVRVWEETAHAYSVVKEKFPNLTIDQKKQVYRLLLLSTMGLPLESMSLETDVSDAAVAAFKDTVWKVMQGVN